MKEKNPRNRISRRGGYRENAGRKPTWVHQETCTIRIPKILAKKLLELAHVLDTKEKIDILTLSIPNETISNSPKLNIVTDSNLGQASPSLTAAIAQAKTVLKLKKSARYSLARLLTKLYSTSVSFEDLK